ncbi:hypothetical protein LX36DRAFT_116539 [Colletotrichum falcatum]|nr:hypothetical protein LX36DRAFT_116539 [Colletotrichum falcatum]
MHNGLFLFLFFSPFAVAIARAKKGVRCVVGPRVCVVWVSPASGRETQRQKGNTFPPTTERFWRAAISEDARSGAKTKRLCIRRNDRTECSQEEARRKNNAVNQQARQGPKKANVEEGDRTQSGEGVVGDWIGTGIGNKTRQESRDGIAWYKQLTGSKIVGRYFARNSWPEINIKDVSCWFKSGQISRAFFQSR